MIKLFESLESYFKKPHWLIPARCSLMRAGLHIAFNSMKRSHFTIVLTALIVFAIFTPSLFANNLSITNSRIISCGSDETAIIEFDISWSNSWRDDTNHDAVWVFVKMDFNKSGISDKNTVKYDHIQLTESGTNPTGFSTGTTGSTPIEIIVPSDKTGAFIRRSQMGSGAVTVTDVQFVWNMLSAPFSPLPVCSDLYQYPGIQVYGIEMVYIPQGGFHAGDGNDGATYYEFEYGSSSSLPAPVNSEAGISFSNVSAGGWYYNSSGGSPEFANGAAFNVSSSYPKGYQAFYLMKYELSAGQYVTFLNALSRNAQSNRVQSGITGDTVANYFVMSNTSVVTERNRVTCPSSGNGTISPITFSASSSMGTGRENRAMNFLNWMDFAAYADWAALRPITELEYEKAARGPLYPIPSEHAWGSTSITQAATISGSEIGTERIVTANANANYGNATFAGGDVSSGPLRCGIFATSTTTTRLATGAGYYGNMELSGNVTEMVVSIGNSAGISFSGTHGDGTLVNISGATYDGNATNIDWPGVATTGDTSRGVTTATGAGDRGGSWERPTANLRISHRNRNATDDSGRDSETGGRLARTAP